MGKQGLRQPGAQEDGKPFIPEDWDSKFKPTLGSYVKFVITRPDQFRIIQGEGAGFYTLEDVSGNKTVRALNLEDKGKGKFKGKGKGQDKGKGKGKYDQGEGKCKASGKGKG